jgi:DNA-binding response OmpR family regulator
MSTPLHILVTDVNHHVRDLLKREFQKEGHRVYLARNQAEARNLLDGPAPLDVVVLDPELPELSGAALVKLIRGRLTPVRIIVHAYPEFFDVIGTGPDVCYVEKSAVSIGPLKERVRHLSEG